MTVILKNMKGYYTADTVTVRFQDTASGPGPQYGPAGGEGNTSAGEYGSRMMR